MMTFIIGGSGSGKSAYAENCLISAVEGDSSCKKYYLATMKASDDESVKKIKRHRRLRKGKGFFTIEQPTDIGKAAEQMAGGKKAALLECLSNLTANEMFAGDVPEKEDETVEKIIAGITGLQKELAQFVIVSNNIFEDGRAYDDATMAYIRAMGRLNEKLAAMADEVIEVVAGIPVTLKAGGDREGCK